MLCAVVEPFLLMKVILVNQSYVSCYHVSILYILRKSLSVFDGKNLYAHTLSSLVSGF